LNTAAKCGLDQISLIDERVAQSTAGIIFKNSERFMKVSGRRKFFPAFVSILLLTHMVFDTFKVKFMMKAAEKPSG